MLTHNLPPQTTPFVGRGEELAEIARLLSASDCRLLTLLGPGGIGKTRLATKIGHDIVQATTPPLRSLQVAFRDGVYFVPLQPLISSDFNLSALVDALNIQLAPDGDVEEQVLRHLRSKSLLLILDNFEHLLDGVGLISRLLAHAPGVKALVTSRAALNLQEEWIITLKGMSYPKRVDHQGFESYDAVQFFIGNARRLSLDFSPDSQRERIARICQLVEGMPLALELAASWVRMLTCAEIAEELERGLDILEARSSNVPERHRTMRATLDHSWALLTETQQAVFRKMTVFRGGFTREAAETVGGATRYTLAKLVDTCWLRHEASGRYDIHELLRQYGEECLNEQPEEAVQAHDAHCRYFAAFLAQRLEPLRGAKVGQALRDIEAELENVRVYWDWAISHRRDAEMECAIESLWEFFDTGIRFQEGEQTFAKAAVVLRSSKSGSEGELLLGKVLARQGALCHHLTRSSEASVLLHESLDILQHFDARQDQAFCLSEMGVILIQIDHRIAEARQCFQNSLTLDLELGGYGAYIWLGITYEIEDDLQTARQYYWQALVIAEQACNPRMIAEASINLSRIAYKQGENDEAYRYGQQSLKLFQDIGFVWGIAMAYQTLGMIASALDRRVEARRYALEALSVTVEYRLTSYTPNALQLVAKIGSKTEDAERAVELLGLVAQNSPHYDVSKDNAAMLAELEAQLPPDVFAAAVERGKVRDWEATVQEIIKELQEDNIPSNSLPDPLTEREVEVLRLVAEGRSNREIARELVLALGTVKWYVSDIFSKLGVANRTQAATRARELQLLS